MIRARHTTNFVVRTVLRRERRAAHGAFSQLGAAATTCLLIGRGVISPAYCQQSQQHAIASYPSHPPPVQAILAPRPSTWSMRHKIRRGWRLLMRLLKLTLTLAPVVAFYPLLLLTRDRNADATSAQDTILLADGNNQLSSNTILTWYLRLCLGCVEWSGAAVIKLMQWAGSRPDLFGHDFCDVFSQLQDHTTPHRWKHTQRSMQAAFGPDWHHRIRLGEILGSGCIGQVYRGHVLSAPDGREKEVAVKVLHPSVEEDIDADLDIMRLAVYVTERIGLFPGLKWLNLRGVVEEFADLLKLQLDLRQEASNLERFNENFKDEEAIVFPRLVPEFPSSKDVLVETFVDGIPVLQFARERQADRELLHKLCVSAIRGVCKMIFLDNFVHGTTR